MAEGKLTKNELRAQQTRLAQLDKYLPTLKLKKTLLQSQVAEARGQLLLEQAALTRASLSLEQGSHLLSMAPLIDIESHAQIAELLLSRENQAGVDLPLFQGVRFAEKRYAFSQTPVWLESLVERVRLFKTAVAKTQVSGWRVQALEDELKEVSIRVNLFEKVLIPRTQVQIRRIRTFLQDQELAGVARAKVAKAKHRAREQAREAQESEAQAGEVA